MTSNSTVETVNQGPRVSARGMLEAYVMGASAVYQAGARALRPLRPVTRLWLESPRVLGPVWRWVTARDAFRELREQQLRPSQYQREWAVLAKAVVIRSVLAAVASVPVIWLVALVLSMAGPLWPVAAAAILAGAGWVAGRLPRRQEQPVQPVEAPAKDQGRIAEALAGRLSGVTPDMLNVSKLARVWTDDGTTGRTFTVRLPLWIDAAQVAQHRSVIAAALATKTDRITVTEGSTPAQAVVHVADKSPSELPPSPWPLADAASFDLTRPIPIGTTPDGKPAGLQLFSRDARGDLQGFHLLLTGMSRYGKSSLLQLVLAACALDERAVLNVAVPQDTRDFEDIAPALSFLAVDAGIEDVRGMLARAVKHMSARAGVPYVVVLDEAQLVLGDKGDSESKRLAHEILSAGAKAGIAFIIVTQDPTGANLSPDLARRPQNRISFRQSQPEAASRAMGAGMTPDTNPSLFGGGDKGLAAVIGEDGFHGRVKTPLLPAELVAKIAADHRREPVEPVEAAAEFPTYALDHDDAVQDPEPAPEPDPFLIDVQAAFPEGRDRALCGELAVRLAPIRPEFAPDDDGDQGRARARAAARVSAALREAGVEARKIRVNQTTGVGVFRQQVEDALARAQGRGRNIGGGGVPEQPEQGTS